MDMTTRTFPAKVTIDAVTEEFLALQRALLDEEGYAMTRSVIGSFRTSVNSHAHHRFDKDEKAFWHQYRIPGHGYRVYLSSLFGPEKIPWEVKYFFRHYLGNYVIVGDEFRRRAPGIVRGFLEWMVQEQYVPPLDIPKLFPKKIPNDGYCLDPDVGFTELKLDYAESRRGLH